MTLYDESGKQCVRFFPSQVYRRLISVRQLAVSAQRRSLLRLSRVTSSGSARKTSSCVSTVIFSAHMKAS